MKMRRTMPLLAALALVPAGCSLAPKTVPPAPPVPQSWPAGDAYLIQSEASLPAVDYRRIFTDPRFQALAGQALANNRDLRIAYANVSAARAQVRIRRADQFPQIGASASARHSGGDAGTGGSFALQGGVASFELDLFGRLANATEAERNRALSTEAAARTVRLSLIADLATVWAVHAADRELLDIARRTADSARQSVRLTRAKLEGGVAPRSDLAQAEQILATAEGDIALQTTALAQDENLVRLLVGGDFDRALLPDNLTEVTSGIAVLPAGTSSDVLLRRPDVIEAEYLLRAANADIGVARAALFPSISLAGLLGLASDTLSGLFRDGAFSYSGEAGASASIFDFGGRRANVAVSEAQRDAALASYEKAIQTAFREVADALATQGTITERERAAASNTAAAATAARLAEARYRGGIDSFLSNLDAQRSLYAAQRAQVAVRLALVQNRITLYQVLGNGA